MQSFREHTSGYHGNQPCYQQEPHELSRLETYRQQPHHPHPQHPHPGPGIHSGPGPGQTRPGYDAHSLANPSSLPGAGGGGIGGRPKDCYSQPTYTGYPGSGGGNTCGSGASTASQTKKAFRGSKVPLTTPSQHLQGPGGYVNPMGPGNYSGQYLNEGHLQQKWDDPAQLAQYDQEMVGRLEPGSAPTPVSSQYLDLNIIGHSQAQCHQPSTSIYTSPLNQPHPPNPPPSPLMYPQGQLHYPQPSPSPSPYIDKCSPMPHCYKGYNIPPNSQYVRQMSSHGNLKPGGYRPNQNSYSYQQPLPRVYEQQSTLQPLTNASDPHPKYPQYSQSQQNYCISDLPVRSPEHYYQTCSPSSNHSPARSVGRSPSYSSTPSPLMTNTDSFQYSQPPITPGAASTSSSSSTGIQEQASTTTMLLPPRSHPSPSVPHAASHSFTTTPQVPTMKERFSEKLLSNPSLWSLNALTSQVENISNNVQQLLLSETLVANKKGSKRSSGGSNSSTGNGTPKKGDEYKSPPYADSGGNVSGGPTSEPYSTPQHQSLPLEVHEGGYSSSSEEPLDRGYYYFGQSRSPAQPHNTQVSLDTASSCSMASPDDMSTRSGDSGLHNLTPDSTKCRQGHVGDDISTSVKSVGDERSPASIVIPSPMKQERDSPSDARHADEPVKENFEESAWTDKSVEKEDIMPEKDQDWDRLSESTKSIEKVDKWSDEEKCQVAYSKEEASVGEKHYTYEEYKEAQSKYDPDATGSVEQSPAALSDSSNKDCAGQEIKTETFKSESPTASESSVKTYPFISRGDIEQDRYSTEKEDSSENASPTSQVEVLEDCDSDQRGYQEVDEKKDEKENDEEEAEDEKEEEQKEEEEKETEETQDTDEEEGVKDSNEKRTTSPVSSTDEEPELEEETELNPLSTKEHMTDKHNQGDSFADLCSRTETLSTELNTGDKFAGAPVQASSVPMNASPMKSAIGDTAPLHQSAIPVFSSLTENAAPPAQARDHSDAKVLEPDSPQLPGKSILPSAPSWANTPPSPKKGDEDLEPGMSCTSAVTPIAKPDPEPVPPSPQQRSYGRKHARGRRRITHSSAGMRQQIRLEREEEKEEEEEMFPTEKSSKTVLFSDQTELPDQEPIRSESPKAVADGFCSRMCTRSFNAPEVPSKAEQNSKRKPGPKPGLKPGPKPGQKIGAKPGPKPGPKHGQRYCSKLAPKSGQKLSSGESETPEKTDPAVKRKPGPKPGPKPGVKLEPKPDSKPGPKPGCKANLRPGNKPTNILPQADTATNKAQVGRPKGSISKGKPVEREDSSQAAGTQSRGRKSPKTTSQNIEKDTKAAHQEKQAQNGANTPGSEIKNMVLRSRKPSKDKLESEKKKTTHGDTLTPTIKVKNLSPVIEPLLVSELTMTPNLKIVKTESILDSSITPSTSNILQHFANVSCQLKRQPSPEDSLTPLKKKRGPKPKLKCSTSQTTTQEEEDQTQTEENVRGHRRKRGSSKKTSVVTCLSKDTSANISGSDPTGDPAAVHPQCPTKTKVLPPRKGRGQKYEAMVQKITSPSSKKHTTTPQPESNLTDDVTAKVFLEQITKDCDVTVHINSSDMVESQKNGTKQHEEVVSKVEIMQEGEKQEKSLESLTSEGMEQEVKEEAGIKSEAREDHSETDAKEGTLSSVGTDFDGESYSELTHQGSETASTSATKTTRMKRKRWAMVESTDVSVLALEAGSLIVTTPRLAKQRAIKNNHEMHLKQRRKKRKDQTPSDKSDAPEETSPETIKEEEKTDEGNPVSTKAVLPASRDEITNDSKTTADLSQKPRRGRKPSSNPPKQKKGNSSSEQQSGKPAKIHKKPGPKPGMKDAIEVIEAVVRAAGCEQAKKEEQENEERHRLEKGNGGKRETCVTGPVVTVTEKLTEVITIKRIRRRPIYQNSKLSFCPFVRVSNSRDFSSWCAVVNKPEDTTVFQRRRKKGILRMRNPFTVAKVTPHATPMITGPAVNPNLTDRCLTCCLCGKPANYKDLGDLCGPYYPENSVPRKVLMITHRTPLREDSSKTMGTDGGSTDEPSPSKEEGEASSEKEESTEASTSQGAGSSRHTKHHHWRYRRAGRPERVRREGGSRRITLRERFRKMKQLQLTRIEAPSDQEGNHTVFQKLQMEAEASEHWAHENCAIWTKGVIMVAGRLYGLKEAASNSAQTTCNKCQTEGASLSCCWRGCSHKYHYVCAKEIGCTFHEDDFSIKCPNHEDL